MGFQIEEAKPCSGFVRPIFLTHSASNYAEVLENETLD